MAFVTAFPPARPSPLFFPSSRNHPAPKLPPCAGRPLSSPSQPHTTHATQHPNPIPTPNERTRAVTLIPPNERAISVPSRLWCPMPTYATANIDGRSDLANEIHDKKKRADETAGARAGDRERGGVGGRPRRRRRKQRARRVRGDRAPAPAP